MTRWQKVKLRNILEAQPKSKIKAGCGLTTGKYPFYTCSNVLSKFLDEYSYTDEALIFGTGGNASIHYCNKHFATSTDCVVYYAQTNQINLKYVYHFFFCNMHLLEEGFKGAGLKHISKTYIENIEIPLPPREEQEKIVQELDTVSDLLAKQKQLLAEQDTLIKSVFYDMFGDPVTNDKGWTKCLLNDVIEYIGDIGSNGSNETVAKHLIMKDEPDYAFMVRTLNLNANDFINNAKYVSEDVYNFFSKSKVFGGEIIMNKIGSAGSFWLMPDLRRPVSLGLNQLIIRLQENANIKYVYYFLKTDFGQYSIQKSLRGAVTKSITKGAVKNLVLYLPPLPLQQKFADIVEQIETQKQKIKSAISETETLFNALMAKYFDEE